MKLYDVRTISGDWPRSVFGITWVYALTNIRNYMATPSQKAVATKMSNTCTTEKSALRQAR